MLTLRAYCIKNVNACLIIIQVIQKVTKNIHAVHMAIKLFVVMTTDTVKKYKYTEEKMLRLNSWRKC